MMSIAKKHSENITTTETVYADMIVSKYNHLIFRDDRERRGLLKEIRSLFIIARREYPQFDDFYLGIAKIC